MNDQIKLISTVLLIITLAISFNYANAQEENPFTDMAGKKYADYSMDLNVKLYMVMHLKFEDAQVVINQIEEAVQKTNNIELKYWGEYFKLILNHRKQFPNLKNEQTIQIFISKAFELIETVKKEKIYHVEFDIRQKIINECWVNLKNYELAFEQYAIQNERLQLVSSDDIPEKAEYYKNIADAYTAFKDYPKAIYYYNKVLEEKDNKRSLHSKQHALNGIGLLYRNGFNDLDRSDSCFRLLMNVEFFKDDKYLYETWNGISAGNMGYNMLLRGEYDKAIILLKKSLETIMNNCSGYGCDYAYASGPAINLADIYVRKGDLSEAKYYIDMARDYYAHSPREGRLPRIYEVLSKYYAATSNVNLSIVYMDSTLKANKKYEEQYNSMILLRLEQQEFAKQQEKLNREIELKNQAQIRLMIISIGFIFIFVLSVLLYLLYRKNRNAYHELVRKSQKWAQALPDVQNIEEPIIETDTDSTNQEEKEQIQKNIQDEIDLSIMNKIEILMYEQKVYKDYTLSVDSLSQLLGSKKHYVSGAINRCTKNNFNTFVNEYRIKEAIRLLSDKKSQMYSIDSIASELGFNDRQNFHRVFKKMTGLSPTEFRKNLVA